jgi:hypothetical protein
MHEFASVVVFFFEFLLIARSFQTRTFPELEYFQSEDVQSQLRRLLVVYVLRHPTVGYRQGMHEIAAALLWVVHHDAREVGFVFVSETKNTMGFDSLASGHSE